MSEIRLIIYVDGVLTDPTSSQVYAGDSGDDYGVQRTDNFDDVVDVDDPYTKISTGYYHLTFDDPVDDVGYRWSAYMIYESTTYYVAGTMPQQGTQTTTVILPSTQNHYTSQAEVLRIMGTMAEQLLLEDSTSRDLIWHNLLQDADDTIKMYVMQHYDPETLYSNGWIRRRATMLVANLLSNRRGSPPIYTSRVDRIYEELDLIRDNRMRIPGATVRFKQGPLVRNYEVQNVFRWHPGRVIGSKSTNAGNYSGEDLGLEPYLYYGSII